MDAEYRILTGTKDKSFFTDQELYFGEVLAHSKVNADGSGTADFVSGLKTFLPQKAEDYGYRQAHVEMLLCLVGSKVNLPKVVEYLNISGNELIELLRMNSCIRYRVLIGTKIAEVRKTTAEAYIKGYQRGIREIELRMGEDGYSTSAIAETKALVKETIRETIQQFQPDGLFEEYMELYRDIT